VCAVTGAAPANDPPADVAAAIDTTGAPAALATALTAVHRGGRLAVVGLYHGAVPIDLNLVVEGGRDVVGCAAFDGELADAVELLAPWADALMALADDPMPLADVPAAYAELIGGRTSRIKALIDPRA
ncbi:MAG: zinc-binding dehydrogenase, partial [Alphaproteobacteria bacterium]|nr:zinc-binding dehydrogenase [Alphaproteobacteria bacterium]